MESVLVNKIKYPPNTDLWSLSLYLLMHDDLLQFVVFLASRYVRRALPKKKLKKKSNYQYHHKVLIMILMTKSNEQASFNYAKKFV